MKNNTINEIWWDKNIDEYIKTLQDNIEVVKKDIDSVKDAVWNTYGFVDNILCSKKIWRYNWYLVFLNKTKSEIKWSDINSKKLYSLLNIIENFQKIISIKLEKMLVIKKFDKYEKHVDDSLH